MEEASMLLIYQCLPLKKKIELSLHISPNKVNKQAQQRDPLFQGNRISSVMCQRRTVQDKGLDGSSTLMERSQAEQLHIATTSLSVSGDYAASNKQPAGEEETVVPIAITYGYSRDHCANLQQWTPAFGNHT